MTARKTLEDRLRHLACHDPVTDLPNRAARDRRLSHDTQPAGGTGARTAVGIIDLDDFKSVNHAFAREAGDLLLAHFGRRVRASLRGQDFLARLGADEFAL